MVLRSGRTVMLFGLLVVLIVNRGVSQEKATKKPIVPVTGFGQPLQELQRELDALRAAGKTNEADNWERQAQQALSGLLLQFRQMQTQASRQQDPASHRLIEVQRLVEQVRIELGEEAAEPLAKRLAAIEQSLKAGKTLTEREGEAGDNEPEVHVLRINAGVALPEEFTEGRDVRTVGYVEVELNYSARPVILVLYSGRPTLWNIKRNDCDLHAILRQDVNQELLGAGDCLVLENSIGNSLWQATGRATATEQSVTAYDGSPVTIGPSNRVWLGHSMLPHIESVATRAGATLTSHHVASLKELRFTAAHRCDARQIGPQSLGMSVGQFTIAGPIANSLEPLPVQLKTPIVTSQGEKKFRFALNSSGNLVMSEQVGESFNSVPVAASIRSTGMFSGFCLDTKRDRLVLAPRMPGALCTYDIAEGKWARLGGITSSVASIVYRGQDDTYFAITRQLNGLQPMQAPLGLIGIDADGKMTSSHQLRFAELADNPLRMLVAMRSYGETGLQLVIAADKLALIFNGALGQASETPLKLLDPKTGDVIYEGPIRVHQGEDPALVLNREPPPPAKANGWLAQVDRLFAKAERVKGKLADEKPEKAKVFAVQLAGLRGVMRGRVARREQEQQYSVAIWHQLDQTVEVNFTDTSGPSRLFLSSSRRNNEGGPVKWQVTAGEGAELKEIVLVAAQDELVNSPAGVTVRRGDSKQPASTTWASPSTMRFNLTTVNGQTGPLTIGPENGRWRAEIAMRQLDRLIENSGIELKSPQLAELEEHRFFAVMRVGQIQPFPFRQQPANPKPSLLAEFTIHGPVIGTEKPVTLKPNDQILATTEQRVYVLEHGRGFDVTFASVDVATDERTSHASPPIRHSARDCRSTFDASRNRLYLSSSEGIQVFDAGTMKWQPFVTRRIGFSDGLAAYNHAADMFYKSDEYGISGQSAKRYNFRGALLDTVPLQSTRTSRFSSQAIQTIGFGHYIGELQYANEQGSIRVTDLRNGDIVYEGPLRQHVDRTSLSADEMSSIYEKLASQNDDSDQLIWQMTAAHNDAVRFLNKKLPDPVVAQVNIVPLVRQLDSDDFAKRDVAFKKLQELGSEIEPAVRLALRAKLLVETRARLERLIKTWESAAPQNGAERQHVHAVAVLRHVGSSPAIALLREIADGRGSPVARRAAREALQSLGK